MSKKISFIKLIRLWGVIFLAALTSVIIGINLFTSYNNFNIRMDNMRTGYIKNQKQESKREVERVVNMINNERVQSESLTRDKIKSRVYEAYSIAQNIYQQNKATKTETEIQQMIIDALRPIRFEYENGYYFITHLDGISILFADKPKMEGLNILGFQDTKGQYVIQNLIKIANQSGQGFYEYRWTKPGAEGNDFKKISFVKRFAPYDWYIGTGLYVVDVEEQIKAKWLERINHIRFGKNLAGYLFAVDWRGKSLAHGTQPDLIGNNGWEYKDSRGNKTTQLLIAASKKKDGGYTSFWWRKPDTGKESSKIAYAKAVPEWELFVGSGVYTDDIEQNITTLRAALNAQTKTKILIFIIIVAIAFTLFFILFNLLSNRLRKDFNLFIAFFDQAAFSDKKIDREAIQSVELDQMAGYANKMLQDKINAQQDLWNERDQLEEDVRLRTIDLTAANKELEAFSYSVSHDLRAPLRAIDGFARILLEDHTERLDQEGRRTLNVIGSNVQKMGRLIDDLLAFSRLDRKKIGTSNVDMNQLTDELIGELKVDFGERVVNFNINSLPDSTGDRAMLREVLFNLMSNALKFTREKNPAMIEITGKADDDEDIYSISDNGVGFDMKYADKLFKVFQRLHSSQEFEGTGIGLALARRIVRKHGGRIWAEGTVGKGAIFYFSLPKNKEKQ